MVSFQNLAELLERPMLALNDSLKLKRCQQLGEWFRPRVVDFVFVATDVYGTAA